MGHPWFGSKVTSGLRQALVALMPPHSVYIETHLGGEAVMQRKPAALCNIGIDLDGRSLSSCVCDYPVEMIHGGCHARLSAFLFDGTELVYNVPTEHFHGQFAPSLKNSMPPVAGSNRHLRHLLNQPRRPP